MGKMAAGIEHKEAVENHDLRIILDSNDEGVPKQPLSGSLIDTRHNYPPLSSLLSLYASF
jgi:hypothetical protein